MLSDLMQRDIDKFLMFLSHERRYSPATTSGYQRSLIQQGCILVEQGFKD